jgi:NAD(P)H-dependent FMN reductase
MELQLPLLDRMYKEYEKGKAPAALENLATLYRAADAFVVVSGEYNHSIQPALSNLLDHFLEEYFFRPSAIVCYSDGSFGGVRAAMQLRAMLGELGMPPISSIFPVSKIASAFADDGAPLDPSWDKRFEKFAKELEWYANALREARAKGTPY